MGSTKEPNEIGTAGQKTNEEIDRMYEEVGERILRCRQSRKMTREMLASAAGISTKFLYEIENGLTGFTIGVLERLACALDVDSDYILHGRLTRHTYDRDLIKAVSAFDEDSMPALVRVLSILAEFM